MKYVFSEGEPRFDPIAKHPRKGLTKHDLLALTGF